MFLVNGWPPSDALLNKAGWVLIAFKLKVTVCLIFRKMKLEITYVVMKLKITYGVMKL